MSISWTVGGTPLSNTVRIRFHEEVARFAYGPAEAMDRIHRLGQHRPVQAVKLVIEDSIESRIIQVRDPVFEFARA